MTAILIMYGAFCFAGGYIMARQEILPVKLDVHRHSCMECHISLPDFCEDCVRKRNKNA